MRIDQQLWAVLCTRKRCFACKHQFAQPFFTPHPGEEFVPVPNGEWLFHLRDTHGLFEDVFVEIVADRLFLDEEHCVAYKERWSTLLGRPSLA